MATIIETRSACYWLIRETCRVGCIVVWPAAVVVGITGVDHCLKTTQRGVCACMGNHHFPHKGRCSRDALAARGSHPAEWQCNTWYETDGYGFGGMSCSQESKFLRCLCYVRPVYCLARQDKAFRWMVGESGIAPINCLIATSWTPH